MGYFPFFIELSDKRGLVVGGGEVALRKIQKLLPYQPGITVIAEKILPEIEIISGITLIKAKYSPEMADGFDFVIAATDDPELNSSISAYCIEKRILINAVDEPESCGFIFPAVIKRKNLSVGISSSGMSPTAAVWLKEQVENIIPEQFDEIIDWLGDIRPEVKRRIMQKQRAAVMKKLFNAAVLKGSPLSAEETAKILEEEK